MVKKVNAAQAVLKKAKSGTPHPVSPTKVKKKLKPIINKFTKDKKQAIKVKAKTKNTKTVTKVKATTAPHPPNPPSVKSASPHPTTVKSASPHPKSVKSASSHPKSVKSASPRPPSVSTSKKSKAPKDTAAAFRKAVALANGVQLQPQQAKQLKEATPVVKLTKTALITDPAVIEKLDQFHKRLVETEKKIAILLSWIRNQYGEDHSIVQLVKASLGQPLDEDLIVNVGKPTTVKPREPLFAPPADTIEYPRHVWVERDTVHRLDYQRRFSYAAKIVKSKKTASSSSVRRKRCKVTNIKKGFDPLPPQPKPTPAPAKRARPGPLKLLEAELRNSSAATLTSVYKSVYTDSEDELLHEPPEFETLGSIVASAPPEEDLLDNDEEAPFQILSTTSLASSVDDSPAGDGIHYNCNDCNKRFISIRQLARHSLEHSKDNQSAQNSNTGSLFRNQTEATSKNTPINNGYKPMPASLSGRAPALKTSSPSHSLTKPTTVPKRKPKRKPKAKPAIKKKIPVPTTIAKKLTTAAAAAEVNVPVKCEICEKMCPNRKSYQVHKLVQHNMKKSIFICSKCKKCCPSAGALEDHQIMMHGIANNHDPGDRDNNVEFVCRHCKKVFGSVDTLGQHLRLHFPGQYSKCGDCGQTFKGSSALAKHEETVHGKMKKNNNTGADAGAENRDSGEKTKKTAIVDEGAGES